MTLDEAYQNLKKCWKAKLSFMLREILEYVIIAFLERFSLSSLAQRLRLVVSNGAS